MEGLPLLPSLKTTYFEVDLMTPFENSMVLKFENFGEKLIGLDEDLRSRFKSSRLKRAIHIGKCFDSDEGVTFFWFQFDSGLYK